MDLLGRILDALWQYRDQLCGCNHFDRHRPQRRFDRTRRIARVLVNSGIISATATSESNPGVLIQGGAASFTNSAGGTVYGTHFTQVPLHRCLHQCGYTESARGSIVQATAGGTFVNSGRSHPAATPAFSSATISMPTSPSGTNSGAINAISFAATGVHILRLQTGSVLDGNVRRVRREKRPF